MTVHGSGDQIESVLAHLRAEVPLEQDPTQQALLHHECGVLEEARDVDAAAREYLAAYNSDPEFREPLEALVRIYSRKRDDKNLPKLLETMVDAAQSTEESVRALWELAVYRHAVENDLAQARSCLEAAVESDPASAACWLELELLAARDTDVEARMRALDARQNLTSDATWQGLLLIDLAELCVETGDVERASNLLDTVVALEGRARFRSRLALEDVARQSGDLELHAHALEGQAELIAQGLDDPEAADRAGVPRRLCTAEAAADAWLRAGELRRRSGDAWGAVAALTGAAERVTDHSLIARLRMAAADAAGDNAAAVDIARQQLQLGVTGAAGAALWLRMAQAAEAEGDEEQALTAYDKALELDPNNLAVLVLRTDVLAAGADASALAAALSTEAEQAGSDAAKARRYVTVAYVRAVRADDLAGGKAALARAAELGMSSERIGRLARTFASLCSDDAWYGEATQQLLATTEDPAQRAALCFELGRARLLSGDQAGAVEAFAQLAAAEGEDDGSTPASWLGRALAAYAVGLHTEASADGQSRDGSLVARLAQAEPDEQLGRGLTLVAAMLGARAGKRDDALRILASENEREPGDPIVALFLANLRRANGDVQGAAAVLSAAAAVASEPALAGALQLEAGFLLWHASARPEAVAAFERAMEYAPGAAQLVLSWALCSANPDDLDARRRAIELAEENESDSAGAALERFGLGVATRDGQGDATAALEQLEDLNPGGDIALAGALARLIHGDGDGASLESALEQIEQLGGAATVVARAERFRMARFVDRDADAAVRAARDWVEAEPSVHAAIEWLAAAYAADDRNAEIDARTVLAEQLDDTSAAAVKASAAVVQLLHRPSEQPEFIESDSEGARLVNLELALPGAAPWRRATALRNAAEVLGEEAQQQAARMAAWSDLANGANTDAQEAFKTLVKGDPEDMASWEGLRVASERVGDHASEGVALAQLGNLCQDDLMGGELWEKAGLILLDHTDAHDDAEIAFARSLDRDNTRAIAFDKLFRRVRSRNDDDRLLSLIDMRLSVTDDSAEITKMYWERARVLRRKGDQAGALQSLKDVTMMEPDHVGALALAGEISIHSGDFAEAAPLLARLATLDGAPKKQRLLSAVAAVDLYEKKLGKPEKALEVLSQLYADGLSTLKVRERLARTAAKVGNWDEAVVILERLMGEREQPKGRADAARLAVAIYRDKLKTPERAANAARRLLEEVPDDKDAVKLLLRHQVSEELRSVAVPRARDLILQRLASKPHDRPRVELIAEIADEQSDLNLRRAAFGVATALGLDSETARQAVHNIDARSQREPQIVLGAEAILAIADPDDQGPVPELFAQVAAVVSEALGPSLDTEDVGRRNKVKEGDPLRIEISRWLGALGFGDFELYVGGRDPRGVKGVAGDRPSLVVGSEVTAPLDAAGRSAVAREVFALRRGTTSVMYCDDHTIGSIVIAVSNYADVAVAEPPYAVYHEVSRVVQKAMSRRIRKAVKGTCQHILETQQDPLAWAAAARRSIDRMALIASADAASVIDQIVGPAGSAARAEMENDVRATRLLSFAMSSEYLAIRKQLGMGVV
jgi:tetratricopeptide (TPR) repeat protein